MSTRFRQALALVVLLGAVAAASLGQTLARAAQHAREFHQAQQAGQAEQAEQAEQNDFTLDGKIVEINKNRLTVDTGGSIIFHVTYNDKTDIKRKDGSAGSAKDLRVGAKIHVAGNLSDSGDVVAARIDLE